MKIPKFFPVKPKKKLQAATRAAARPIESYDDEPQTKLSSAFIVVLILHVVAVGGIYAFNSIKAHRRAKEPIVAVPTPPAVKSLPPAAVPELDTPLPTQPAAKAAPEQAMLFNGGRIHRVKSGENLTKIAAQHSVTVAELAEVNGLKASSMLRPDQSLNIPPAARPEVKKHEPPAPKVAAIEQKTPTAKTYVVMKGDNPVGIARKLNVNYDELMKLNKISDPKKLKPGQPLKIPAPKKAD
ncbi:MAG TPA: LysM peptidoglycan-binding domain-containing protein [Chthoniobacteraceae bacterium]|jgi:LysM repeat protein